MGASQMPIVTSCYWNGAHGMDANDLKADKEGMQIIRILAKNMVWMLQSLKIAREYGVPYPEQEESVLKDSFK